MPCIVLAETGDCQEVSREEEWLQESGAVTRTGSVCSHLSRLFSPTPSSLTPLSSPPPYLSSFLPSSLLYLLLSSHSSTHLLPSPSPSSSLLPLSSPPPFSVKKILSVLCFFRVLQERSPTWPLRRWVTMMLCYIAAEELIIQKVFIFLPAATCGSPSQAQGQGSGAESALQQVCEGHQSI